jgi:hypothetical protein
MAFRQTRLSGGGSLIGNVGSTLGLLTGGDFAAPLWWLCHRPCYLFDTGGSLVGGNRGIQKCDSVDPLSLVIKCLGGGA